MGAFFAFPELLSLWRTVSKRLFLSFSQTSPRRDRVLATQFNSLDIPIRIAFNRWQEMWISAFV